MSCRRYLFVLILSSCSVGPNFTAPQVPMPETWANLKTVQDPFHAEDLAFDDWWRQFNDPVLSELISRGVKSNLDLKIAAERVRQARSQVTVAKSAFYPSLGASASARRSESPRNQRNPDNESLSAQGGNFANLFAAGFDAAWELDVFGRTRRQAEVADALLRSTEHDQANVLITVAGDIGSGYTAIRALQQRILVAENTLQSQRQAESIAERRVQAGFANALDLANARTQAFLTEAQIPQLRADLEAQKNSVAVLLGILPEDLPEQLMIVQPLPDLPKRIPIAAPVTLLRRRPDILRAEAGLHAATAQIGVAIADLFPSFSLSGFIGLQGDKTSALKEWHNHLWNIAGSVSAPLFEGGRLTATVEIQRSARDAALFEYERVVLNALAEIETAINDYLSERIREESLRQAVVSSKKALELSTRLYADGLSEFLNVLEAQRSHYASQQSLLQSRQSALTDSIRIYKAFGGGWESAQAEAVPESSSMSVPAPQ